MHGCSMQEAEQVDVGRRGRHGE